MERQDSERTDEQPQVPAAGSEDDGARGTSELGDENTPETPGEEPTQDVALNEADQGPKERVEEGGTLESNADPEEVEDPEVPEEPEDDQVDPEELLARLEIKDNHIRELYERIAASRLAADEAAAVREAGAGHIRALEDERERLKERIRTLEEELRERRRRREGTERNVGRLERENERLRAEVARRDFLLRRREQEMEAIDVEAEDLVTRKDVALIDALRRVEGLERDLDERETEVAELRANVDDLRADLKAEYDLRSHLAEPANRLRAGIDLFNDSEQLNGVLALSRTLGQPEVHVDLEDGQEPAVILTFTWQGVSWQAYSANPGLAVEEPRVYLHSIGEDLSGVDRKPPNARIGPGGRVLLGL